ncbi:MAG TPA: glycerophosphodiester phosphodiesterase [Acidimicrobiia bacterium]|nr:glycerophosphodiester phosphodiesterase [Acidimicrobiia bacterium]
MAAPTESKPFGIAHRGSRILWPENTMVAFDGAVRLGFRWVETDLHLTSDGVLVCLHDATLDRTTDRTGPVSAVPFGELERIDAGHRHAPHEDFPFRNSGARIPTLEELVVSYPDLRVVVDLKRDGMAEPLWRLVERLGLHDRLVVGSFSDRRLSEFRRVSRGSVATSTGPMRSVAALAGAVAGRAPKLADAVQFPVSVGPIRPLTRRTVASFRRRGYQAHVWTVNAPAAMHRFYDLGVDAVITDRPDLLRDVLQARGAWE